MELQEAIKKFKGEHSTIYIQRLFEALRENDLLSEFEEILEDGYSGRVQIQFDDDNYSGEPFNGYTRKTPKQGDSFYGYSPVLDYFVYKNRKHYLVSQG